MSCEQRNPLPRSLDPRSLRRVLGTFPTGVVVSTAWDPQHGYLGMTMNSFASVSLDPPLVLFSIDRRAVSLAAWLRADGYAINVLARRQEWLSKQFARAGGEKWQGVSHTPGLHNAPLLEGAIARLECTRHQIVDGGDHVIFLAQVRRVTHDEKAEPLVFHRGRYGALEMPASASPFLNWPLSIHY